MSVEKIKVECADYEFQTALDAAKKALQLKSSNQESASMVRRAMDSQYGAAWSCIAGRDFGSEVPYLPSKFAFFTVDGVSFLCCKSSDNVAITQ